MNTSLLSLFIVQLIVTSFLCGLIWTIQLVHYPAFSYVNNKQFSFFHQFHSNRISLIVMPMMVIELAIAGIFVTSNFSSLWIWNLVSVAAVWVATFALSVPLHIQLEKNKDRLSIKKLVATNWVRTFIWSFRVVFLFSILISTNLQATIS